MLQFFKWYLPITGGTTTTEYEDTWTMFALFSQSEASGFLFFFGFSLDWKTLHVCCTVTFMKYTVWCAISLEGERYRLHRMGSIKTFFWAAELTVVYIWSFKEWDALFDAITGIKRLNYCTLWALSLNSHFFGCELRKPPVNQVLQPPNHLLTFWTFFGYW